MAHILSRPNNKSTSALLQKGASLLEVLLVLAAFAVLIVLILVGNSWRQAHTQSVQAEDAITAVFGGLQDIVINQKDFAGISMTTVANMRNLPVMLGAGPIYKTPWGGVFSLARSSSPADTNDLAAITLTLVPRTQCQDIATSLSPFLYDTKVNGKVVALGPPPTTQMPGRANVIFSKLQLSCKDSNTMIFRQMKSLNASLFVKPEDVDASVLTDPVLVTQRAKRFQALQSRETIQSAL